MKLAFYAPLKPPTHTVPSGDRQIARSLMSALEFIGADVTLASVFRSRDGAGDSAVQSALFAQAKEEANRVIEQAKDAEWQAWITYHNYYKAPDLIGPEVSRTLGIPYLQVESTRARKRLNGPWHAFAEAAEDAADAAKVIYYFTERDSEALLRDAPTGQRLVHLRPFLSVADLPDASVCDGPMLSVGMMRAGDKFASYQLISEALTFLDDKNWRLQIVGDGPARSEVEMMFVPFADKVEFLGALTDDALKEIYQNAGLLFWPGVNEAFGMTYLEAQSYGLPVVAQDRPGVRDVLASQRQSAPEDGPEALALELEQFLKTKGLRQNEGQTARDFIAQTHLLPSAAQTLKTGLELAGVST